MKILAYAQSHLEPIARGELPMPLDWHIYPSNICNHKCVWCMFRQNGEQFNFRVQIPRPLLLRAVTDAARTGAVHVEFAGGGEPLINKATPAALELAQRLGAERKAAGGRRLWVGLTTNGRLLTPEIAALCDSLRVSLNAGTAEQHLKTNHANDGAGDWHEILDAIRAARPHRKQDLGLAFVVDADNYQDITPFVDLAIDLDADFVHIRPAFWYDEEEDRRVRSIMPAALKLCEAARDKHKHARTQIHAITEKFEGFWSPRSYHRCRAVLSGACLRATGDFAVCQDRTDLVFGKEPSYALGATFEEVWHSDEHAAVVARIHDGEGGELSACPRCVWNGRNNAIEAIERDDLRIALV